METSLSNELLDVLTRAYRCVRDAGNDVDAVWTSGEPVDRLIPALCGLVLMEERLGDFLRECGYGLPDAEGANGDD